MKSDRVQHKSAILRCFEKARGPQFKRTTMILERQEAEVGDCSQDSSPIISKQIDFSKHATQTSSERFAVLVINSSHEMAKEITLQLTLGIPGCTIMYAPTVELAKWILRRRKIKLVVSSPVLFDGGINRLKDTLESLESPPEVVVVGNVNIHNAELFNKSRYEFSSYRRIKTSKIIDTIPTSDASPITRRKNAQSESKATTKKLETSIKTLGADLRNDLNNPLQEIVAMVFVAQNASQSALTEQALTAIDTAAKNMAHVVNALEDKIRGAVGE